MCHYLHTFNYVNISLFLHFIAVIKEEPTDNYNDDIAVDDSDDMATFVTVNPVVEISTPDIPTPNSLAFRHRTSQTTVAATALGTPSSASYRSVNRSPASSFGYAITNRSRGGPAAYAAATTVAMAKTTSLTSRESELGTRGEDRNPQSRLRIFGIRNYGFYS